MVKKISAVVITKNEAHNIERCLKSLAWVDEIVVYDSGSSDQTVSIAKNMGAKVYEGEWLGFGPSKKKATNLASHEWIISLDADEEIPPLLADEIKQILKTTKPEVGYLIPRLSFYMASWIRHGGWYPDYQLRLFNKTKANWNSAPIHEKVEALKLSSKIDQSYNKEASFDHNQGPCSSYREARLKNHLHHYVFKNIEHHVQTNNRYTTLQAEKMFQDGKRFSYFHFFTKPYVKFVECYVFKLGFLDGWAGYTIARSAAYAVFLKWIKLKEIQNKLSEVSK